MYIIHMYNTNMYNSIMYSTYVLCIRLLYHYVARDIEST